MAELTVQVHGPDGYIATVAVGRRIPDFEAIALCKSQLQQQIEEAERNLHRINNWSVRTMRGKVPALSFEEYGTRTTRLTND